MKICGITGGGSLSGEGVGPLTETLETLVHEGVREFVVVMDRETGLPAANAVLALKQGNPNLRLTCLLLWEEQAADWPESVRETWFNTIALCDREVMLERHRSSRNEMERDRFLMRSCDGILICGARTGAFWALAARAEAVNCEIRWLEA